jgi:phage tail sheath gpL-like
MGCVGFTGSKADFITAVSARNSKFVSWVPVEDSPTPSYEIAASAAALYASRQEVAPGTPMRGRTLVGVRAGQAVAWNGTEEDTVVKAGGSTTRANADGTVKMQDFVTTYKTNAAGAVDELYRFTCWLGNWQFKLYSLNALYNADPFIDSLTEDDGSKSEVSYAISPKIVKTFAIQLIDQLWVKYGLTKNRDEVVKGIKTEIDSGNPGRINLFIPDVFSAGLRIIAGKIQWSFYAPAQAA